MTIWRHFIGGFYTPEKFICEARKDGVSRRVAPGTAKAMTFGDDVQLLYWRNGKPVLIAEFTITTLLTPAEIGKELGSKPISSGGGESTRVVRACGSYEICGSLVLEADSPGLGELVSHALEIAGDKGIDLWFMIGGSLSRVYEPAIELDPPPRFSRGFTRFQADEVAQAVLSANMLSVQGYSHRKRKYRKDLQYTLQF
jgi:hypothetical protein